MTTTTEACVWTTGHNGDWWTAELPETGETFADTNCPLPKVFNACNCPSDARDQVCGVKTLTNRNPSYGGAPNAWYESDFGSRTVGRISAAGAAILRAGRAVGDAAAAGDYAAAFAAAERLCAAWSTAIGAPVPDSPRGIASAAMERHQMHLMHRMDAAERAAAQEQLRTDIRAGRRRFGGSDAFAAALTAAIPTNPVARERTPGAVIYGSYHVESEWESKRMLPSPAMRALIYAVATA